jgi:hypothetical protein
MKVNKLIFEYGKKIKFKSFYFEFIHTAHPAPNHFLRVDNVNAIYETDTISGRHSVLVPFEKPAGFM